MQKSNKLINELINNIRTVNSNIYNLTQSLSSWKNHLSIDKTCSLNTYAIRKGRRAFPGQSRLANLINYTHRELWDCLVNFHMNEAYQANKILNTCMARKIHYLLYTTMQKN